MFDAPADYVPSPAEVDMRERLVPSEAAIEFAKALYAKGQGAAAVQEAGGLVGTILVANKKRGWWTEEVEVLGDDGVVFTSKKAAARRAFLQMTVAQNHAGKTDVLAFEFTVFPDGTWAVWSEYPREFMGVVAGVLPREALGY